MLKKIILTVAAMLSIFTIMQNTDIDVIGNAIDFVAEEHEISYYSLDIDGIDY